MHAVSSGFLRLMRSAVRIATIESGFSVGTLPAFFIVASIALFTPSLHAQIKASLPGTPSESLGFSAWAVFFQTA